MRSATDRLSLSITHSRSIHNDDDGTRLHSPTFLSTEQGAFGTFQPHGALTLIEQSLSPQSMDGRPVTFHIGARYRPSSFFPFTDGSDVARAG
jgi:hypothetical protein